MAEINANAKQEVTILNERLVYKKKITKRELIELWAKRVFLIIIYFNDNIPYICNNIGITFYWDKFYAKELNSNNYNY